MKRLIKKLTAFFMTIALALGLLAGTAVPARAESAPSVSITPVATYSYGQQAFTVYAERDSIYYAYVNSEEIESGSLSAGTSTLTFNSSSAVLLRVYTQYDRNDDGVLDSWNLVQGYSSRSYYLTVTGVGSDGRQLFSETLLVDAYNYPEYVYTPQASIQIGDTVYTADRSQYLIQYGDGDLEIPYSTSSMEDKSFTVSYLDEQDNVLYSETRTLSYGETADLTAPASYQYDGQEYQLTSAVQEYHVTYDNAAASYVFEYAQVIPEPETPYEITINLVDAENGNELLYSIRQTVDVDSTVRVELPSTYEVNFKQYQLAEGVSNVIEREFSSTRSTVYNIPYVVSEESAPYEITLNFVDYENPETVLSAMTAVVTPDGTPFVYDVSSNSTLEINGTTYQLMAGQGNGNGQIVHTYGGSVRTYSVYYAAQEVEEAEPYTVTLRYISVLDNQILETQQLSVAYGSSVSFEEAPATLNVDGIEYTRLNGQEDAVVHDYNESQTSYAVYYMETASLAEAEVEPEVITQVVTQYVTQDGTVVENADGTVVPVTVQVTTVTDGTGGETTYNEDGQEVVIENGNITVIEEEEVPLAETPETEAETEGVAIEDEEVPLASAVPGQEDTGLSSSVVLGVGAGVAAVLVLAAAILLNRKKKNA